MTLKKLQNLRPPKSCQIRMANLAVWAHLLPRGPLADLRGQKSNILRLTLDPQNAFESIKSLVSYRFGPLFLQHFALERCKKHYIYSILYYFTWKPGNRLLAKMAFESIPQLGCANGCPKLDLA